MADEHECFECRKRHQPDATAAAQKTVERPKRTDRKHDRRELRIGRSDEHVDYCVRGECEHDAARHCRQESIWPEEEPHESSPKPPEQDGCYLECCGKRWDDLMQQFDDVVEPDLVKVEKRLIMSGLRALGPS